MRRGKGCIEKGSLRKESMEVGVRVRGAWEGVHREVHRKGVHLEGVHGGGGGVHGEASKLVAAMIGSFSFAAANDTPPFRDNAAKGWGTRWC